jgi:peptide/nickel transport system permease protein
MKLYVLQRLVAALPVLLLVTVITFSILHFTPGDPAVLLLGDDATEAEIIKMQQKLGLDRPVYVQYWKWLTRLVQGDFGNSVLSGQPVLQAMTERLEQTLVLSIASLCMAVLIALPLGIIAAWKANTWIDRSAMVFATLGFSIPAFLVGINLIYLFSVKLHMFPVMGYVSLKEGLFPFVRHLALPTITLALAYAALIGRMTRATMLEILREDYIRTARAKGLQERLVLLRHALRNAAIPIVEIIGISFGNLVAGVVVTETVFAIPGLGRLIVEAVANRDYPIIQGSILLVGLSYVLINLIVDLLYCYFDPRVKY